MGFITVHSVLTVLSVSCAAVISGFAVQNGAGYSPAAHPFLMSIGVLGFFSQGVLAYVANYGSALAVEDRKTRRTVHGAVMLIGMLCVVCGYLVVYAKLKNKPLSSINHVPALKVHSALGYIAFGLLGVQVIVGMLKLRRIERDGRRTMAWHGILGPLVYLLCLICVMFGFNGLYSGDYPIFSVCVTAGLICVFLTAVAALFCGPRRKRSTGVAMPSTGRAGSGASGALLDDRHGEL